MYSSADILTAMDEGKIQISDFDFRRLGPNSYDLLLGDTFFDVIWDDDGPWYIGPRVVPEGEPVHVPVSGTILGMTKDVLGTNENVVVKLQAKSSIGRMGITICRDAGLGDVGYNNHWTLEMTGYILQGNPFIVVGEPIAQAVFYEVKTPPLESYSGQYKEQDWPLCMIPSKWRHRVTSAAPEHFR